LFERSASRDVEFDGQRGDVHNVSLVRIIPIDKIIRANWDIIVES
jgi:hypothetical protein